MSAKVNGLGHIGFYVKDLELMKDFYGNFMGMTLTRSVPSGHSSAPTRRLWTTRSH